MLFAHVPFVLEEEEEKKNRQPNYVAENWLNFKITCVYNNKNN